MTKDLITMERQAHHNALATLSTDPKADGLKLWRKLRRIEGQAHKMATDYCNGDCTGEQWDAAKYKFTHEVFKAFGQLPAGFFVNGDARGYALKLDPDDCTVPKGMHTDWGRYGILAPEIN